MIKVRLMKYDNDEGEILSLIEFQERFNSRNIDFIDFGYKIEFIVE